MSILKRDKALATQFAELTLTDYVTQFIKQCPVCQKLSTLHVPIQARAFTTATYEPHQRLNVDTIGPLPSDADGNCYILVLIDTFTRWIELYPIKTVTALDAAKVLLQHFGRFGQAQELQSDNGSQFVNEIIKELCLLIGVEHKRTLAYSSEENAIVERANKEVLRHLRAIIHDTKVLETWNVFLPFVQRIMNAAVSQTTGVSPAQLLFGCAITLDRSILVELPVHVKQDLLNIEQGKQGDFESRFSIHNPSCSRDRIRPNPLQEDYFYMTRIEKERNERMARGETTEDDLIALDKMKWDEHTIPLDRWVQEYKQDVK
jgi:hypothetical protein